MKSDNSTRTKITTRSILLVLLFPLLISTCEAHTLSEIVIYAKGCEKWLFPLLDVRYTHPVTKTTTSRKELHATFFLQQAAKTELLK